MARGQQIYVLRDLAGVPGFYQHHGIDCGDGSVIHYSKTKEPAEISRTSYDAFTWGNSVSLVPQADAYAPDVIIQRAESRLGERQYDLLLNNCEHFATWCATGRSECYQLASFGLRADQLKLPELRRLVEGDRRQVSPAEAWANFHKALGDIATAYTTTLTSQQAAQKEADDWQRVAQAALGRDREDLARAALHKRVAAQRQVDRLTAQLHDLVDLELDLQRQRALADRRIPQD